MSAGHVGLVRAAVQACGLAIWRLPSGTAPTVFLTFDDGPHPVYTLQVVELLRRHAAPACFFMNGLEAERYPEIVRSVVQAGHGVANHGFVHLSARSLSRRGYVANAERGHQALEAVVGHQLPRLFRPPHGRISLRGWLTLRRRGFHLVLWSHDSGDGALDGDGRELPAILALERIRSGQILLLHDDHPPGLGGLSRTLAELGRAGFRFGRLDEALSSYLHLADPVPAGPPGDGFQVGATADPAGRLPSGVHVHRTQASG